MRRLRPLERLVIMNVPHPGAAAPALRRPRQLLRSWYAFFFQVPRLPEWLLGLRRCRAIGRGMRHSATNPDSFPDAVLDVFRDNAARPGALKAMLDYYRALVRGGGARRQRALGLPRIETPTLMIWGQDDPALGVETTYGTDHWIQDLTLRYLPGVSHWVQQEAPETVNAMLEAWLGGHPVPGSADPLTGPQPRRDADRT
jgi:pimeloyl-ACP methyl ester carboxylesterase